MSDAHGHDAHGHDDHHDHALPPPEPDKINNLNVFLWGIATFILLIVSIVALGSYFWVERVKEDVAKVDGAGAHQVAKKAMLAETKTQLTTYKKVDGGKVQIPIDQAMKLIVKDYAAAEKAPK